MFISLSINDDCFNDCFYHSFYKKAYEKQVLRAKGHLQIASLVRQTKKLHLKT